MLDVPAELRVLRVLLSMATKEEVSASVRLIQDELASYAATTRPTANRAFARRKSEARSIFHAVR